jgi:hypothetical protein
MSAGPTFVHLEQHLRRSIIYRTLDGASAAWTAGSHHSRVGARVKTTALRFMSMPPDSRVRAVGLFVAAFAIAEAVLQRVVPAQVAAATPLAVWILVAAFAMIAAALAEPVAHAWPASRLRRWWRE